MNISEFYQTLWQDYLQMTPQAKLIFDNIANRGENIVNDHVAFRTFNRQPLNIASLEPLILELGYIRDDYYHFEDKKLDAYSYIHKDSLSPRIFISELRIEELSSTAQNIIETLLSNMPKKMDFDLSIFWQGRLWPTPTFEQYQILAKESEYAAWLSIMGIRTNHFTISVNELKTIRSVEDINTVIESLNLTINSSGGKIKGSPEVLLEQSSTMASHQEIEFANGEIHKIPTCYYEFAKRYSDKNGNLYQGFVAASADKIFESTDAK